MKNIEQMLKEKDLSELNVAIAQFNAKYAEVLDDGDLMDWPSFFSNDAIYKVTSRENFERNLPVGLVYCERLSMIKDRALAISNTAMFAPRYLRHFISNTVVEQVGNNQIVSSSNYILMQTLHDNPESTLHQVGKYNDIFVVEGGALKLKERICIYDNLLLDNSLVYPV
ncbi:aromatic-ring-hydroxylating dioxygenase subunit beta [Oceanisphaera sediminis]|uniref:Aromatic-ring-hydroxylating dioxygenase subunit beta n=1 Tax=Oceanisphaera sediminis TaxID=981381 RepID=A0ABP7DMG6_9GAMM